MSSDYPIVYPPSNVDREVRPWADIMQRQQIKQREDLSRLQVNQAATDLGQSGLINVLREKQTILETQQDQLTSIVNFLLNKEAAASTPTFTLTSSVQRNYTLATYSSTYDATITLNTASTGGVFAAWGMVGRVKPTDGTLNANSQIGVGLALEVIDNYTSTSTFYRDDYIGGFATAGSAVAGVDQFVVIDHNQPLALQAYHSYTFRTRRILHYQTSGTPENIDYTTGYGTSGHSLITIALGGP